MNLHVYVYTYICIYVCTTERAPGMCEVHSSDSDTGDQAPLLDVVPAFIGTSSMMRKVLERTVLPKWSEYRATKAACSLLAYS